MMKTLTMPPSEENLRILSPPSDSKSTNIQEILGINNESGNASNTNAVSRWAGFKNEIYSVYRKNASEFSGEWMLVDVWSFKLQRLQSVILERERQSNFTGCQVLKWFKTTRHVIQVLSRGFCYLRLAVFKKTELWFAEHLIRSKICYMKTCLQTKTHKLWVNLRDISWNSSCDIFNEAFPLHWNVISNV